MSQTIDINDFLAREKVTLSNISSDLPDLNKISNPFEQMLNDEKVGLILSNAEHDKTDLKFGVVVRKPHLFLIEKKGEKSREFHFDFTKKFLQIEKRRATSDTFKALSGRLKKIAVLTPKLPVSVLIELAKLCPDDVQNSIVTFFKDTMIDTEKCKPVNNVPEKLSNAIATRLLRLASLFLPRKVAEGDVHHDRLETLKQQLMDILGDNSTVFITDRYHKNPKINAVHSLKINKNKVTFVEKSNVMKNVLDFDLDKLVLKLNKSAYTDTIFEWALSKIQGLGQKLDRNNADLFVS